MSQGGFSRMQNDDDSDEEVTVKRVVAPETTFRVKLVLGVVGFIAVVAVLITIVAVAIGAASYEKEMITASMSSTTQPPASSSSPVTPTSNPLQSLGDSANCGYGNWKRIAYINMSDPKQQCPQGWRGYTTPVRSCGRPVTSRSTCAAVYFSPKGMKYSKVCGRAVGYQQGSPDGFKNTDFNTPLDGIYVDGISMTHGNPRTHIWTFAAGLHIYTSENTNPNNCPCEGGRVQPDFVGGNFFCGSGDHDRSVELHRFYDQDPLWDGSRCPNTTGCPFNSPPWFSTKLPMPTSDDIEVRICGDQSTGDEDTPLALLEIYVQ